MKNTRVLWLLAIFFLVAPMVAWADDVILVNGPDVLAMSNNAVAWGGKFWAVDDAQVDDTYWAYYAVHALALVPGDANGGYAYAKFTNVADTFTHTQQMGDDQPELKGSVLQTNLAYDGSVEANVDVYGAHNEPGIAYANLGAGAANFHFDAGLPTDVPERIEATNYMIGGAGQLSALMLPHSGTGNARSTGTAMFDQELLGNVLMNPSNGHLASDEVLEIYGNVNGGTEIAGISNAVDSNGEGDFTDAQGDVFGIAGTGTIVLASRYGNPNAGHEGISLAASGKFTLAGAEDKYTPVAGDPLPAEVQATATGETYGGAWDGATPIGTTEIHGLNENVRTSNVGTVQSKAETVFDDDFALAAALTGDVAFHVNSPLPVVSQLQGLSPLAADTELTGTSGVADQITSAITDSVGQLQTNSQVDTILNDAGLADNLNKFADTYTPSVDYVTGEPGATTNTLQQTGLPGPDIVALDFGLTGAVVNRGGNFYNADPLTEHVTAEGFIKPGTNLNSYAANGDHVVTDSMTNLDQQSGAHAIKGPKFYGSIGLVAQGAAQDYSSPFPSLLGGVYGTGNAYILATLGPAEDGQRWDDAGSRSKMDAGDMFSASGSHSYDQANTKWDSIAWIVGDDSQEQLKGGEYTTTFTKNGGKPQAILRHDGLVDIGPFFGARASAFGSFAGQVGN